MTQEIVKVGKHYRERHGTTISGPQAAAILNVMDGQHVMCWVDKSVDGLPIAELWVEINRSEELAGTYS